MRHRTLDDDASEAWFVCDEGVFLRFDGVRWLSAPREHGLDLNRNFPGSWAPFEMFGMDAGDYPLSEPESQAVVRCFRERPRIAAAVTNHTYTGCLLTQPYREPSPLPEVDIDLMDSLARLAVDGTGYTVFKVVPDFTYDPKKPIVGVWADTMTASFGVPGYTLELWSPFRHAGVELDKPAEFFRKPDQGLIHTVLDAFVDEPDAIRPWQAFEHPQLGPVEIGGFAYMTTIRNPPERLLHAECERGYVVADRIRRALPSVVAQLEVVDLGSGLRKVRLVLENHGWLPTSSMQHAESIGTAAPVHARIDVSAVALVEGVADVDLGWLDGWGALQVTSARHPIYPGLPQSRGTRAVATWIVRGEGDIRVSWDAGRGGTGEECELA